MVCYEANRQPHDDATPNKIRQIVVPHHGANEVGKGLEKKIKKQAGL